MGSDILTSSTEQLYDRELKPGGSVRRLEPFG